MLVGLRNQYKNWKITLVMEGMWSLVLQMIGELETEKKGIQCESEFIEIPPIYDYFGYVASVWFIWVTYQVPYLSTYLGM